MSFSPNKIKVGARDSRLSKAQVREVFEEIKVFHPEILFEPLWIKTSGDLDQQTSLRTLQKTDFFTKEVDQLLLEGECRIAIHSAKDLPDPLTRGLKVACITQGVDPSDSLVFREGEFFSCFGENFVVATSSSRREEMVKELCSSYGFKVPMKFVDIRGAVDERLQQLVDRKVDGVVVATAALIRLGLHSFTTLVLPGSTAPLQGKLAVIVRENDYEMEVLFSKCAK